jgi:hypothetical protein
MSRFSTTAFGLACMALFAGACAQDSPSTPEFARSHAHDAFAASLSPSEIAQALKDLRARSAPWHNEAKAEAAGYVVDVGCTDERTEGLPASIARGMGYHTVNPDLIDDRSTLLDPELLVYSLNHASQKLELAGFDYFIPGAFYPGPDSPQYPGEPPILEGLGTPLLWNDAHDGWIGHVWPWRHNPDGMFQNFNPTVPLCTCLITPDQPLCT